MYKRTSNFLQGVNKHHPRAKKIWPRKITKKELQEEENKRADVVFRKVEKENASASDQCELAEMYVKGRGVIVNHIEALRLYRLALDQGYVYAARGISELYLRGKSEWEATRGLGVEKNIEEARKWYRVWEYCYYKKKIITKELKELVELPERQKDHSAEAKNLMEKWNHLTIQEGLKWYRHSCPKNEDICVICDQKNHNWRKIPRWRGPQFTTLCRSCFREWAD